MLHFVLCDLFLSADERMRSLNLRFDGIFISRGKLYNLLVAHWQNFKGRRIQICSSSPLVPHLHPARESDFRRPRRAVLREWMPPRSLARRMAGSVSYRARKTNCEPFANHLGNKILGDVVPSFAPLFTLKAPIYAEALVPRSRM